MHPSSPPDLHKSLVIQIRTGQNICWTETLQHSEYLPPTQTHNTFSFVSFLSFLPSFREKWPNPTPAQGKNRTKSDQIAEKWSHFCIFFTFWTKSTWNREKLHEQIPNKKGINPLHYRQSSPLVFLSFLFSNNPTTETINLIHCWHLSHAEERINFNLLSWNYNTTKQTHLLYTHHFLYKFKTRHPPSLLFKFQDHTGRKSTSRIWNPPEDARNPPRIKMPLKLITPKPSRSTFKDDARPTHGLQRR